MVETERGDAVTAVIGLEIHVELATATKMFCRCRNRFADPPNTNVCPVCIGMPGVLPVMNRQAVEHSIKVALGLGCTVAAFTKWDRKGYYYPDLPKNYQISQYDLPLGAHGELVVPLPDGSSKRIGVLRAHLEEDAGKNVHNHPAHTGVDLNRAGVPLLEIVSQPDMNSVEEVMAYARSMHRLVRWLGVSEANMQMGHVRFEPNINLHVERGGRTGKTPIVEVKNLNSFRALEHTVRYEIDRQYEQWLRDPDGYSIDKLDKQNRGYDDERGITVYQREKEESHDYRYFPDPDLVPVRVAEAWRRRVAATIGELPLARRRRYIEGYGLTFKEADALTQDAPTGDLLDAAIAAGADAKRCTNLLLGRAAAQAKNRAACRTGEDARGRADQRHGRGESIRQDGRRRLPRADRGGRRAAGRHRRRGAGGVGRGGHRGESPGGATGYRRREEAEEGLRLPDGPGDAAQRRCGEAGGGPAPAAGEARPVMPASGAKKRA